MSSYKSVKFCFLIILVLSFFTTYYLWGNVNTKIIKRSTQKIHNVSISKNILVRATYPKWFPGEWGRAVTLSYGVQKKYKNLIDDGYFKHKFNEYASNLISVRRNLIPIGRRGCTAFEDSYKDLPATSIIIVFHNEAWSTLVRTVHSILERTPDDLIKEIILVDDFSNMKHLKKRLDDYFRRYGKVKIVRSGERIGLIKAKLLGAQESSGRILTFMDAHCECMNVWLEPLLFQIKRNPSTVAFPIIDVINPHTMEYKFRKKQDEILGGFDFNLRFTWHKIPARLRKELFSLSEPVPSPTTPGMVFSIDRLLFEYLGRFDPEFRLWGGENLELSFKAWMCGGGVFLVPCSAVGHLKKITTPYSEGVGDVTRNLIRLAEVWLDEYKVYFYGTSKSAGVDIGDLSERKALREKLKCKSFKWFMETVFPEAFVPETIFGAGEVRNLGFGGDLCLDSNGPILNPCHRSGGSQFWVLFRDERVENFNACLTHKGGKILMGRCDWREFKYEKDSGLFQYSYNARKCLQGNGAGRGVTLEACDGDEDRQKWSVEHTG